MTLGEQRDRFAVRYDRHRIADVRHHDLLCGERPIRLDVLREHLVDAFHSHHGRVRRKYIRWWD